MNLMNDKIVRGYEVGVINKIKGINVVTEFRVGMMSVMNVEMTIGYEVGVINKMKVM